MKRSGPSTEPWEGCSELKEDEERRRSFKEGRLEDFKGIVTDEVGFELGGNSTFQDF